MFFSAGLAVYIMSLCAHRLVLSRGLRVPPLPIALTIQSTLPWLSPQSRGVINALVAADGQIKSAGIMAARLRIGSRFQLARLLRHDGLPPFGRLSDWVFVLQSLWESEATGAAMLRIARRIGVEPATTYRCCTRTLGISWRAAQGRGFAWALLQFLQACRRPRNAARRAPGARILGGPDAFRVGPPSRQPGDGPVNRAGVAHIASATLPPPLHPVARLPLDQAPTDIAITASGAVYVTRAYAAVVQRLDLSTLRSVCSIPVGVNPTRIALEPTGRRAYVSNQFSDSVSVIDTATDTVVDEIPVAGDPAPLLVSANRQTLYVTTNLDRLFAIDVRSKRVIGEADLPAASHHLALHPDRKRLFVATRSAGVVLELEAKTLERLRSFRVHGYAQGLVVGAAAELYIANESGWLDALNLETGDVVASLRMDAGAYGLDVSPDLQRLFVTLPSAGRVAVLSCATLRQVQMIQTGGTPRHTAFSADGRTAVIVNEGGWVDVVR
jgi:YVTN family beta-propeller protein